MLSDANRHVNIYQSIMNMNFMEGVGSTAMNELIQPDSHKLFEKIGFV